MLKNKTSFEIETNPKFVFILLNTWDVDNEAIELYFIVNTAVEMKFT